MDAKEGEERGTELEGAVIQRGWGFLCLFVLNVGDVTACLYLYVYWDDPVQGKIDDSRGKGKNCWRQILEQRPGDPIQSTLVEAGLSGGADCPL